FDFNGKKILDIGAGTGGLYDFIIHKWPNCDYLATDISGNMLSQSNIPINRRLVGSLETLNFPKRQFDFIFLLGVTSYLQKSELVNHLTIIRGLLNENGRLVVSFTHKKSMDFWSRKMVKLFVRKKQTGHLLQQKFDVQAYSLDEIEQ
ncbi:MAG: class I SAM-dependent methyltransferase, partial [Saprospiraceae bacterium]|nr:class I SAM-dependent methyltransferase [Saprospiraceae bacterium]